MGGTETAKVRGGTQNGDIREKLDIIYTNAETKVAKINGCNFWKQYQAAEC
jgi:hypothetical protein